jgi:hypothetical protein
MLRAVLAVLLLIVLERLNTPVELGVLVTLQGILVVVEEVRQGLTELGELEQQLLLP